ncbi:tyrosine-type recombinase/integrase [bacterium]|nr:tyrosine-type recombinase/integrase [bacterium]
MSSFDKNRRSNQFLTAETEEFLVDRQSRNFTPATLAWYHRCLTKWLDFCAEQGIESTQDVTASHVRRFLVQLGEAHSRGGVATLFTGVRAYLNWYADEYASKDWNPLAKVKAPKRPKERLEPLTLADFQRLVDSCESRTFAGDRDRTLLYLLLDTGLRHLEATQLHVGDVNLQSGQVLVRQGKGQKARVVFIGQRTKRSMMAYLRHRGTTQDEDSLWVSVTNKPLGKSGLRQIVRRAADRAGLPEPGMHAFRRAFAVNSLRNGMDVVTLQRLMGHADLSVIDRYLALLDEDLQRAHDRYGVVDNLK